MASQAAEGHVAGTEAPASQPDVFPPFDTNYFAPQIVWLAITFGLLYLLMSKIALPRVAGIISARRNAVDDDLAAAAQAQFDASEAAAAHAKTLAGAKARAQELGQQAHSEAAGAAGARRARLEADLAGKLADAEKQIGEKKSAAMANVDSIAIDATHAILQQLTGKPVEPDAVAAAVAAAKA
ncbi:F0F1 ATP synthase subunit B family protein [Rhodoblastus sp.]|uniref:F0F1 ATP synthase subunit B family protein n=1 Tax=Rhodoblastus sp. TaxID=1962975 RepID=UPI003F973A73